MVRCMFILVVVLTVSAAMPDDIKEKTIKQETEKLQGKWELVGVECKGRLCPPKLGNIVLIKGNKLQSLDSEGKVYAESVFRFDPTQTPKTFDKSAGADAKDGEFYFKGIYKLEDDTLTIHFPLSRIPCSNAVPQRPKEFQITDVGIILIYRRVEQKRWAEHTYMAALVNRRTPIFLDFFALL
jgi:uncharacterized protein (TIGR03067 family)